MVEQIEPLNEVEAQNIQAQNMNIVNETISVLSAQYLGTNAAGDIEAGTLTPAFNSVASSGAITAASVTSSGAITAASVASSGIITAANGTAGSDVVNYGQFPNISYFATQSMPNGFKIQAGQTTTAATSGTITFNAAFTNIPLVVLSATGGIASEVAVNVVAVDTVTYTASVAANVSYIAVGI